MVQQHQFVCTGELVQKCAFRFGLFVGGSLDWGGLSQLIAQLRLVAHHLGIEPEEVPHLIKRHAQRLDGLRLGERVQSFHQFRIAWGLHGGTIQFLLDGPQVFGNARDSEMKFVHVFESHSFALPPSHRPHAASRCPTGMRFGNSVITLVRE